MSNSNYQFTPTLDGLNNINGDTINCIDITSENATITQDLKVGNTIYTKDLTTSGTITANGNITQSTGVLSIPNFVNVESTLTDFSNRLQGVSYNGTPDATTIDNNVIITKDATITGTLYNDYIYSSSPVLTLDTNGGLDVVGGRVKTSGVILDANTDLTFTSGTGKIVQTSGTSTNQMNAITLNNGQDLRLQTSGRLLQDAGFSGINSLKATVFHTDANITQSGTGIISQTGTGTNALVKTNVTTALGATTTSSFSVVDGTKNMIFIPNVTAGSYSGINTLGDSCIFASTGTQNGSALTLTTWNNNSVGIRINGATSVVERAGTNINTLSATDFTTNAITKITNTTASTSGSDGALVVSGGVGIGGTLNCGTLNAGSVNPTSITTSGSITLTSGTGVFTQSSISNQNNDFTKTTITSQYASSGISNTLRVRDSGVVGKQFSFNPNIASGNINAISQGGDSVINSGTQSSDNAVLTLTTYSTTETGVRIAPTNTTISNGIMKWSDGSTQYGDENQQPMAIVEDVNFFLGRTDLKVATFDLANTAVSASTQALNLVQMGIVRIVKGETYSGVWFWSGSAGILFKCALYNTGASPTRLAQRVATNYTSVVGWNVCPFDSSYLNNDSTKYVCIMLVPTNTTHPTYIFNNGNTNWGRAPSAGNINLLGSNYSGFTGTFPTSFSATPATASKYFLGLY